MCVCVCVLRRESECGENLRADGRVEDGKQSALGLFRPGLEIKAGARRGGQHLHMPMVMSEDEDGLNRANPTVPPSQTQPTSVAMDEVTKRTASRARASPAPAASVAAYASCGSAAVPSELAQLSSISLGQVKSQDKTRGE